jgi:MoaA/NifB/PqqE/SkfB family radical SAM enzyme
VHDEYRVTVDVSGTLAYELEEELEAVLDEVDVSVDGSDEDEEWTVYAYASSR